MRDDHFQKFAKFRASLIAAEAANPGGTPLKVLHSRASALLDEYSHMFTDEQYTTLSGTPKTVDPGQ